MYCKNCGKEIDDNAYVCVHCGVLVKGESKPLVENNAKEVINSYVNLLLLLSILIGFIGAIIAGAVYIGRISEQTNAGYIPKDGAWKLMTGGQKVKFIIAIVFALTGPTIFFFGILDNLMNTMY